MNCLLAAYEFRVRTNFAYPAVAYIPLSEAWAEKKEETLDS